MFVFSFYRLCLYSDQYLQTHDLPSVRLGNITPSLAYLKAVRLDSFCLQSTDTLFVSEAAFSEVADVSNF